MSTTGLRVAAFTFLLFSASQIRAAEPKINLLGPTAKLVAAESIKLPRWAAAVDGSVATIVELQCKGDSSEVVVQVADEVATASGWKIHLAKQAKPIRVEILGSTRSSTSGFTLLRGDSLTTANSGKVLTFRPRGVKFVMLRFTPMDPKQKTIHLAEAAVLGQAGPPQTSYSFQESPARALDVLAQLKQSDELMITITADEADLFADARDGSLDKWSLAEAMLLASGVTHAGERKQLLAAIDRMERDAREATKDADTAFEKGDALLRWLHREDGPLAEGYASEQTRLDVLLQKKTFNCVSSAAIFTILAKRLGLDARAIEVPDHAFAVVYDGAKHADVETTNGRGFNPARDRAAREAFKEQTGLSYIPDSHRDQRREINASGLVAITYYNRGVMMTERHQHHRALMAYFRAMSMDSEFKSAVKNALSGLVNWGNELLEREEFATSVKVIETGLALAPKDASLLHNQEVAYSQWAKSLGSQQKNDAALEVLRTAAKSRPDGDFVEMQSWIFIEQGEEQIESKRWPNALARADEGLSKVDAPARKKLVEWRQSVLLRWSNNRLDVKDYAKALLLLEQGLTKEPTNSRFINNVAFVTQQWAAELHKTKGVQAAQAMLIKTVARHPDLDKVQRVATNFARNGYVNLRKAEKFDDAAKWLKDNQPLLDEKESISLRKDLLQAISTKSIRGKDWVAAERDLHSALQEFPNEGRFQQNLAYVVQNRAKELLANGPKKARAELLELRKRYEKQSRVLNTLQGVLHEALGKQLAKSPRDAWTYVDSIQGVLPEAKDAELVRAVADQLAGPHYKKGKWQDAIAIYKKGLSRLPKDRHLRNNAVATWHAWARGGIDAKDWNAAAKVYRQAMQHFPNEGSFKQNLEYCEQQLKQ